jgi:hypothetical protein
MLLMLTRNVLALSSLPLLLSSSVSFAAPYPYPFESCQPSKTSKGHVCVQNYIAGAVSGDNEFVDYGQCEVVREQRPYWFVQPQGGDDPEDPRLKDPAFKKEYDWVVSQIRSVGCSCCHTAKSGVKSTKWDLDARGVFADQLSAFGLAVFTGENVDFHRLARFDPKDNYGFDQSQTAVPTQDPQRFRAFFLKEAERRGITVDELRAQRRFPGGAFDVAKDQPTTPCEAGIGVRSDGTVHWGKDAVRYVYVMRQETENPLGPPSLHRPEGTIWSIRMISAAEPLTSGIAYGERPLGAKQEFPALNAKPAALKSGETYKLLVAKDFLRLSTNCEFVYGAE